VQRRHTPISRHREAREELVSAIGVLSAEPDAHTVAAMLQLAALETFASAPDADQLTSEALEMGQDLQVDGPLLVQLMVSRGTCHNMLGRRVEAAAYYRDAARLAEKHNDGYRWGLALVGLSDALAFDDPKAAADAAREAIAQLRHTGSRNTLAVANMNLVVALLESGDWDGAEPALSEGVETDRLGDVDPFKVLQAWRSSTAKTLKTRPTWPLPTPTSRLPMGEWRRLWPRRRSPSASPRGWGSEPTRSVGPGRWPSAPPTPWGTRGPSRRCWHSSTPSRWASSLPCSGLSAAWRRRG
jgi:tetratricopeptide (TPR) repeat protein